MYTLGIKCYIYVTLLAIFRAFLGVLVLSWVLGYLYWVLSWGVLGQLLILSWVLEYQYWVLSWAVLGQLLVLTY